MKSNVHFAHANGFPAGSYQQVFTALSKSLSVCAHPHLALDANFNQYQNWQSLVDELIHFCETQSTTQQPLWAVGHSMGAIVSFKACCQRPELFAGLVMLDPPLVTGPFAPLLRWAKKTRVIDHITPASLSAARKQRWLAADNPVDYFRRKALFKNMHLDCIQDYVDAALTQTESGRELVIPAKVEAQLFRHIPDDLNSFSGQLSCPAFLITGRHSEVCKPMMYKRFVKKHQIKHKVTAGGHMFPLEHPLSTAHLILECIGL